jgi:hypothetical protein
MFMAVARAQIYEFRGEATPPCPLDKDFVQGIFCLFLTSHIAVFMQSKQRAITPASEIILIN